MRVYTRIKQRCNDKWHSVIDHVIKHLTVITSELLKGNAFNKDLLTKSMDDIYTTNIYHSKKNNNGNTIYSPTACWSILDEYSEKIAPQLKKLKKCLVKLNQLNNKNFVLKYKLNP